MNLAIIKGNLGRDPETRTSASGVSISRFSVGVQKSTKEGGTDWINCTAFGKTADFVDKYFRKGNQILINGHIDVSSYTDKEGRKAYSTQVIADRVEFCGNKNDNAAETAPDTGFMTVPDGVEQELPFY